MESSFLWHTQEVDSVAHELKTDLEQGLSNKEAESRLVAYGPNELPETRRISWTNIFFRLHVSLMIPFMVLALVILIITSQSGNNTLYNLLDGTAAVIGVLIVNIILSGFQEIRSEKLLQSLKKLARTSIYAKVLRSGSVSLVKATSLVPGDIICFETGDQITADGRLTEAKQLVMDESVLMETTEPIKKDTVVLSADTPWYPINQRKNMVFTGGMVTSGSGRAIVTATGAQTQMAQKLVEQSMEAETDQRFLLEANLLKKGLWFAAGCVTVSAVLWALITLLSDISTLKAAIVSLTFLAAAWPMGLIETSTMSLVIGMERLIKHRVLIRQFSGAETLASATVICSDKTGIMTQNHMSVRKVFVDGHIMDVEGDGYDPESGGFPPDAESENPDLPLLLTVAAMCTNTEVKNTPEGWTVMGNPAEGAQIIAAMKGGINKDELGLTLARVAELPFDDKRKRMSIIFEASQDELFVFTSGSLEAILDVCSTFQLHGYMDNLDVGKQRAIWAVNESFARDSMRSLAFAYCQLNNELENYTVEAVERNLVFIGMMGIVDPPREDAGSAVRKCLDGGVATVILTGDSVNPAFAFAQHLGIVRDGSEVITGEELDILGEKEYSSLAQRFSLYADISPAHRLRVVHTLREKGEIVALIGSHRSDAPAVEEADIGIAAGRTASSVTIDAADIVLTDDSFATAVDAIEGMRGAYSNNRKIIRYFLSGSAATVGTLLLASTVSIFWKDFPFPSLSFLHVLWINLLAGSICAFAMIYNPVTDGVMKDGPYSPGSIFDDRSGSRIPIRGILTTFLALVAFTFSQDRAATAAVTVLIMSQLAFAFQCRRTPDEGFFRKYLANKLLLGMTFLIILLHLALMYISPLNRIFGMDPLLLTDWIPIIVAFAICSLPLDELFKPDLESKERDKVAQEPEKQTH